MNVRLIKLSKEYYTQLSEMIDEWKLDQEVNQTNHSPWAIFKNDYHDFDYYLDNLEIREPKDGKVPDSVLFLLDVERDILLGAVNISINSSLPYQLNAYMPSEISNSDKSQTLPIDILNIKDASESDYKQFANTTDKIVLKDGCTKGNDKVHTIDLKLASNQAHKADIYKTVIKFEAEQK